MKKTCVAMMSLLAGVLLLTASPVWSVELLTNGNFEVVGEPPGWSLAEFPSSGSEQFNTASQIGFADIGTGELGLWLMPFAGGAMPPGTLVNAVLSQTVPAVAGEGYSFSGWSLWELFYAGGVDILDPNAPLGAVPSPTRTEMELAFLDAAGSVIGTPHLLDLRTVQNNFGIWLQQDFDTLLGNGSPLVAPAGTVSARVTASMLDGAYNAPEGGGPQSAFFDDFSLVAASDTNTQLLANAGLDIAPPKFPGWDLLESPEGVNTAIREAQPYTQNTNTSGVAGVFLRPWANGGLVEDPNDAILSQTVDGDAGREYTFTGWSKFEGNYAGGVDTLDSMSPNGPVASPTQTIMELAFLDGTGVEIGTPITLDLRADREAQSGGTANDNVWYQHSIAATAPDGTAQVRVTGAMLDGVFNVDSGQSAFFDDFSLMDTTTGGVDGDFNGDGNWNCADINALTAAIASGSTDLSFDMNGDGSITSADITEASVGWLAVGGANNPAATGGNPFISGDADLSGAVDVSDFNIWNSNKFTANAAWCAGDFNADGSVDVSDFNVWNGTKFSSSTAAVPEPAACVLLTWLAVVAVACRRRHRR